MQRLFKAHRLLYHSTLGLRVIKEKKVHTSSSGSYSRLTDSCITQIKAHGPSRTCNESKIAPPPPRRPPWPPPMRRTPVPPDPRRRRSGMPVKRFRGGLVCKAHRLMHHSTLGLRVIKKKKKGRPAPPARRRRRSGMSAPRTVITLNQA